MAGIDYSKWDKMDYGESSSDESAEDKMGAEAAYPGRPRVTRLDGPARVTRDADGMITIDSSGVDPSTAISSPSTKEGTSTTNAAATTSSNMPSTADTEPRAVHAQSSQTALDDRLTTNGGRFIDEQTKSHIFWSQDRQEVVISVEFDAEKIKSRNIQVEASGMVPYSERNAAVAGSSGVSDSPYGKLKVTAKLDSGENATLLEGDLTHSVHLAEDEDDIEWDILSECDRKFVRITLRKAVPMAGIVVWWDQILQQTPKIDLSSIRGRGRQSASVENAWEEAHRMFKEKVKKGQVCHSSED